MTLEYWEECDEQSEVQANMCQLFHIPLGGLEDGATLGRCSHFYRHLILKTVFQTLKQKIVI